MPTMMCCAAAGAASVPKHTASAPHCTNRSRYVFMAVSPEVAAYYAPRMENLHPTLAALVRDRAGLSWARARKLCTDGRVTVDGERCLDPAIRVGPGSVIVVDAHGAK